MLARYVHGPDENKYAASITISPANPAIARYRISSTARRRRSAAAKTLNALNVTRIGGRITPENFDAMAAPVTRPKRILVSTEGRSPCFQNRYRANNMNTATGTS